MYKTLPNACPPVAIKVSGSLQVAAFPNKVSNSSVVFFDYDDLYRRWGQRGGQEKGESTAYRSAPPPTIPATERTPMPLPH